MANFVYNEARYRQTTGDLDWDNDSFELALVMTNSDIDDKTLVNEGDEGTLDEFDGVGYSRLAIANPTLVLSTTVVNYNSGVVNFVALANGTRDIKGGVLIRTSDSLLVAWIDEGFPIAPGGRGISFSTPLLRMT